MQIAPFLTPLSIKKGNCHALRARRGATVICLEGVLSITEPAHLVYEDVAWQGSLLHSGEAHVVEHAGWLHCTAITDAQIACAEPPPSALLRLVARATGRFAAGRDNAVLPGPGG